MQPRERHTWSLLCSLHNLINVGQGLGLLGAQLGTETRMGRGDGVLYEPSSYVLPSVAAYLSSLRAAVVFVSAATLLSSFSLLCLCVVSVPFLRPSPRLCKLLVVFHPSFSPRVLYLDPPQSARAGEQLFAREIVQGGPRRGADALPQGKRNVQMIRSGSCRGCRNPLGSLVSRRGTRLNWRPTRYRCHRSVCTLSVKCRRLRSCVILRN